MPQMNGRAPNWPATGSHTSVTQKCRPNFSIASHDWRTSSTPIPATSSTSASANSPVPSRNPRSERRCMTAYSFNFASASSSIFTTPSGSGAYPRSAANFCPSVSAHFTKSAKMRPCCLSFGLSYRSSHVNDEIG